MRENCVCAERIAELLERSYALEETFKKLGVRAYGDRLRDLRAVLTDLPYTCPEALLSKPWMSVRPDEALAGFDDDATQQPNTVTLGDVKSAASEVIMLVEEVIKVSALWCAKEEFEVPRRPDERED